MDKQSDIVTEPSLTVRQFGLINWVGVRALYVKEIKRFTNVITQTIVAPVINNLLFFAIFALALGGNAREMMGIPFMSFLAPGIIMMTMVQNSFANPTVSLVLSKVQGNIVDLLMSPLSSFELVLGFLLASITRGLLLGVLGTVSIMVFYPVEITFIGWIVAFAVAGSSMLSLLGIITGIWANKFDQMSGVTNFVITPLTFLSGTFYSITILPDIWQDVAHYNPFFYMIDGFRYGFVGQSDADPVTGILVLIGLNILLFSVAYQMVKSGYKIKS
jgi:ABC-2 type transport system permease protein